MAASGLGLGGCGFWTGIRAVGGGVEAVSAVNGQAPTADKRIMRPFAIRMTDGQGSGSLQVTFHELVPNEPIKPSELGRV